MFIIGVILCKTQVLPPNASTIFNNVEILSVLLLSLHTPAVIFFYVNKNYNIFFLYYSTTNVKLTF